MGRFSDYFRLKALLELTVIRNPFIPVAPNPRQVAFLIRPELEVMYGGAGGGGKSYALLMAALQFVHIPNYRALIIRRTFAQLEKGESIMQLSHQWLRGKATWQGKAYRWTFPSGATLEFGHLSEANAELNYQGAAFQFIGFDELTQFEEHQYRYLFSRLRRRKLERGPQDKDPIPLRCRSASNPGGVGHYWVYERFIRNKEPDKRAFVPAKLADNPMLDIESYRQSLSLLPELTRKQIEDGDWNAVEGGHFKRENFRYFNVLRPGWVQVENITYQLSDLFRFTVVDSAASSKQTSDETAISTFALTPDSKILWLGCRTDRQDIPQIVPLIVNEYFRWKPHKIGIEAIASNCGVYQLAAQHTKPVLPVLPLTKGAIDKLVHATGAIALVQSHRVYLPQNDPDFVTEKIISQLVQFTGNPKGRDDIVDTLSYACQMVMDGRAVVNSGAVIPQAF